MKLKRIKVLHIQETIASGGVERTRLSLAKLLNKNIFEQKIICTNVSGNIVDEIRNEGVEIFSIGTLKSPFQWSQHKKVQKIIDEYKPNIIHGAVFEGVTMAAINGWLKKVPIIIIEETSDPQSRSWRGNLLMKLFSFLSNKVVGVSEAVTEEYLKGMLKIPARKVVLINNGVALPREMAEEEVSKAKEHWGINDGDFVIGSLGRMWQDENKRFSDLIKAFAKFSEGRENVKLVLVGDGPERPGYKELAKELNISDKVIFAGYQPDVTLYYNLMDVFSLVSAYEAFGLVLAEAMLNKLPVVATRVGGMKYIVDHEETGFLVQPLHVEEIADRFEYLFQSPLLVDAMRKQGYQKAMSEYTEEKYVASIESLYCWLVKSKEQG